ncbi:nose resistant to fluoxetine protein 6-like [Oppia nitens]|uniref:nose resistant to fluoxetine protein 6-like n=1 Tax=Oppia nitens TaxID=1686743 RepID=UPI0023DBC901|nr:nose resistant to fluoxetine protein 6-like [Oppia nitens]
MHSNKSYVKSISRYAPNLNLLNDKNDTKIEVFSRILNHPLVSALLVKLEPKLANFSENIKLNLKDLLSEAKEGLSGDSAQQIRQTAMTFIENLDLSPLCLMSFVMMKRDLSSGQLWPLKFIDSLSIRPLGLLEGTFSSFGLYDECLDIENDQFLGLKMRGQYCLAKRSARFMEPVFESQEHNIKANISSTKLNPFGLDNNMLKLMKSVNYFKKAYFRFGLCIPSTCSPKEINRVINKLMTPKGQQIFEIEKECKIKNREIKRNAYQRTAQSILITLTLLVIMSTAVEFYYNYRRTSFGRKKVINKSLLIFSAISNTNLLFRKDPKRLNTIGTIIWLFVSLEFVGRSYVQPIFYSMIGLLRPNKSIAREYFTSKKFFWIRNSSYSMTLYILLSAIVLGYNITADKRKAKYSPLYYLKYIVNRYLSIFRRIIGPILLIYLIPLIGDGPIWHYYEPVHVAPCKNNLMSSLLLYSNYMPGFDQICNLPSATFSAIFQLSLLAPLILLLVKLKHYIGYSILALLVCFGCFFSLTRRLFTDFPIAPFEVTKMHSIEQISHSFIYYLGSAEQNLSTLIIGLLVGYLIRNRPDIIKVNSKHGLLFMWCAFLALPQIASYWSDTFKALKGIHNETNFLLWFLSGRVMWALGYGWIVFACSTNRGGIIQRILTNETIQPLSRLAFGIYLNHINVISIRLFAIKQTYFLTHSQIFESVIIDYAIAVLIAYIFYILIECPIYHLIKIICGQYVNDSNVGNTVYERTGNGESVRDHEHIVRENIEIKVFANKNSDNL